MVLSIDNGSEMSTKAANFREISNSCVAEGQNAGQSLFSITAYASSTFLYDYRNRLATSSNNVATTTYAYDHTFERVLKKNGSVYTRYPNDLYEQTGTTTATRYIYANGELIATVEITGGATTTSYIHPDHLGGTNIVTDENGLVSQVLDYYPYGSPRVDTGTHDAERTFIGERYDTESSLSYLNARMYDGGRGQFQSQDPVFWEVGLTQDGRAVMMNPQAQNSYSYALNNPITHEDPSGRIIPAILLAYGIADTALDVYDYALTNTNIVIPVVNQRIGYKNEFSDMEQQYSQNALVYDFISSRAAPGLSPAAKILLQSLEAGLDTLEKLTGIEYSNSIFKRQRQQNNNPTSAQPTSNGSAGVSRPVSSSQQIRTGNGTQVSNSTARSVSRSLSSASKALGKGDLKTAKKALERASRTLSRR